MENINILDPIISLDPINSLDYLRSQVKEGDPQKRKIEEWITLLTSSEIVDLNTVRNLADQGIPDSCSGLRALVWKLLLGYLPPQRLKWKETLLSRREIYQTFLSDFFFKKKPPIQQRQLNAQHKKDEILTFNTIHLGDHPLSLSQNSRWKQYFGDADQYSEIEKDTERTRCEEKLFISYTDRDESTNINFPTPIKSQKLKIGISIAERHCDVLARILFINAKLNVALNYVQGMNEILSIIYYACHQDRNYFLFNEEGFIQVEADSFFCFIKIMGVMKDIFIREVDDYQQGLKSRCNEFQRYLKAYDNDLWYNFVKLQINSQYYSLRWFLLLFAQDFNVSDTLRIWDTILSKKDPLNYVNFIGLALLHLKRESLMSSDFTVVMMNLQKMNSFDVKKVISLAADLEKLKINPAFEIPNIFEK